KSNNKSNTKTTAKKTTAKTGKAAKTAENTKAEPKVKKTLSPAAFEACCIMAAGFGILVIFSLFFASDTIFGQVMLSVLKGFFGIGAYIFPFALILAVIGLFMLENRERAKYKAILCCLLFIAVIALIHVLVTESNDGFDFSALTGGFTDSDYIGGGFFGGLLGELCLVIFNKACSVIIFVFLIAALSVLISGKSIIVVLSDFWHFISNTIMGGIYREEEYYDDDEYYDGYDDYYDDEVGDYYGDEEYEPPVRKAPKRIPKISRREPVYEYEEEEPESGYYEKLRKEKSYKDAKLVDIRKRTGEKKPSPDIMSRRVAEGSARIEKEKAESKADSLEFLKQERTQRTSSYIPEFLRNKPKASDEYAEEYLNDENAEEAYSEDIGEEVLNYPDEVFEPEVKKAEETIDAEEIEYIEEGEETEDIREEEETVKSVEAEPVSDSGSAVKEAPVRDIPPWEDQTEEVVVPQEVKDRVKVVEGDAATVKKLSQSRQAEYRYPKLSFLDKNPDLKKQENNRDELIKNSHILEETLKSFKVSATVVEVSQGPTITRYELVPAVGTKVKSIASLDKDLAMRLAAEKIMIEAPIPGKTAVGIEIPNEHPINVHFSEVVASKKFQSAKSKLTFALGKDVAGNVIIKDIAKAPHFLIAGATNSGKSVCINTLINCLLYKATPDEVRLILVDPKMVELNVYNGIPHLLIPVVTDPHKASAALNWACTEMMRRYKLCADVGVRNLDEYNEYLEEQGQKPLYKLVIIIDELADLMLVAKKEVEGHIQRLTQLARAAGIHLIVATQRPSSDVITGVIKSNIPSRIAFSVAQAINSRIILDESGAEKLIGRGDMLVKTVEMDRTLRVQGAFITNEEIKRIVDYIKTDENNYDMSVIESIENADREDAASVGGSSGGRGGSDELTDDVIAYIVKSKKASTSLIQRQFQIGYNRAARIIDELEDRGIIGPENGAKPRAVLMDKEEWREYSERRNNMF
ncbi:MAG: DNA translocase FtsK 4TM domain-containing protein, partial [Eubacterium sp.]|nr:DNA translocase FtsK 4TM domain-containing protein [Eubacterium sp.]